MAFPSKITLIVNNICLTPIDSPKFSTKSQTKHYLTPIRYRKSNPRPKRLPKLVNNIKITEEVPSTIDICSKYYGSGDFSALERLIQNKSKSKLKVIEFRNNGYIKSSKLNKYKDLNKIRSNEQSSIGISMKKNDQESIITEYKAQIHKKSLSTLPGYMVDATFNTDY